MASSVLRVPGGGSATALRWGGKPCVVTAWHVVEDYPKNTVWIQGNNHRRMVGPFKRIAGRDLAWVVLEAPPTNWQFLEVAGNEDNHGACMVWGFVQGQLSAYRCTDNKWVTLGPNKARWFSGTAIPGMSGGPIVDNDNRVIGVVSHSQRPYNQFFYAAPVCDIVPLHGRKSVPRAPVSIPRVPLPSTPAPEPVPEPAPSKVESSADLGLPAWAAGR